MIRLSIVISFLFFVAGCSTFTHPYTYLEINSDPPGAQITELGSGKTVGFAPLTVAYDIGNLVKSKSTSFGCYDILGFSLVWPSGAAPTRQPQVLQLCDLTPLGVKSINYVRDRAHENFDEDMKFADQLLAIRAKESKNSVSEEGSYDASMATLLNAIGNGLHSYNASKRGSSSILIPLPRGRDNSINKFECISGEEFGQLVTRCR